MRLELMQRILSLTDEQAERYLTLLRKSLEDEEPSELAPQTVKKPS